MTSLLAVLLFAPISYCATQDIKVPIEPEIVLEPVPGIANFLKNEGFEMTAPRFHSDWFNKSGQMLTLGCAPTRERGGIVRRQPPSWYNVEVKNSNASLRDHKAVLAASESGTLKATFSCPGGQLSLILSGNTLEPIQYDRTRTEHNRTTIAKTDALELLAELATRFMDDFKNPKWFESLQLADENLASKGFRRSKPESYKSMRAVPDWYIKDYDLSITFGNFEQNRNEINANGLPISYGAAGIDQIALPELEIMGLKACIYGGPNNIVTVFVSKGIVYRVSLHRERRLDRLEPIPGGQRIVFDKELLSRFTRTVVGLKKIVDSEK